MAQKPVKPKATLKKPQIVTAVDKTTTPKAKLAKQETPNKLYYGDNLEVLRKYIHNETIDLCYIDPPFN